MIQAERLRILIDTKMDLARAGNFIDNLAWIIAYESPAKTRLIGASDSIAEALRHIEMVLNSNTCFNCGGSLQFAHSVFVGDHIEGAGQCRHCQAITGRVSDEDSLRLVSDNRISGKDITGPLQFFDIVVVENGLTIKRRFGWFDPESRRPVEIRTV